MCWKARAENKAALSVFSGRCKLLKMTTTHFPLTVHIPLYIVGRNFPHSPAGQAWLQTGPEGMTLGCPVWAGCPGIPGLPASRTTQGCLRATITRPEDRVYPQLQGLKAARSKVTRGRAVKVPGTKGCFILLKNRSNRQSRPRKKPGI